MGKLLYLIMFEMYGRVAVLIKKKKGKCNTWRVNDSMGASLYEI